MVVVDGFMSWFSSKELMERLFAFGDDVGRVLVFYGDGSTNSISAGAITPQAPKVDTRVPF